MTCVYHNGGAAVQSNILSQRPANLNRAGTGISEQERVRFATHAQQGPRRQSSARDIDASTGKLNQLCWLDFGNSTKHDILVRTECVPWANTSHRTLLWPQAR
jgi:hypothetical protein